MWTCPRCGEPNEDPFDSCWRCARESEDLFPTEPLEHSPRGWWRFGLIACEAYILAVPTALLLSIVLAPTPSQWGEWMQQQLKHQRAALSTGLECGYVFCLVLLLLGAMRYDRKVARQASVFIGLALVCLLVLHPFTHVLPARSLNGAIWWAGSVQ